jgi:uncharacterized membrane protein
LHPAASAAVSTASRPPPYGGAAEKMTTQRGHDMQPEFVKRMFGRTIEQLDEAERRILHKAHEHQVVSTNVENDFQSGSTLGERLADGIARVGGSWNFIIAFLLFLVVWAIINTLFLTRAEAFDPYPFIFLNLVLSMVAAIQAPIIMMSQNRQSERDRFFAAKDYEVNLKAEIEVMALHHKIDITVLLELQNLRADIARLSEEIARRPSDQ